MSKSIERMPDSIVNRKASIIERLKSFFSDDVYIRNQTAAYKRNKTVLRVALIGSLGCTLILLIASWILPIYSSMNVLYMVETITYVFLVTLTFLLNDKANTMLAYVVYIALVVFCIYNSAVIWPDDVCVMVLSGLFIFPTLFLDKNWKVILMTLVSAIVYIVFISEYKTPKAFGDEAINVACFTLIGCIVGSFTRKAQLENFDSINQIRMSRERYRLAVEHNGGFICEFDVANRRLITESETTDVFVTPRIIEDMPYLPVRQGLIGYESVETYIAFFDDIINGKKTGTMEFECKTVDGWRWHRASYSTIYSDDDIPVSAVVLFNDITESKEKEEKQKQKAELDGLTGVNNRLTTEEQIKSRLSENKPGVFLIADIDNLKHINDNFGHPQGDIAIRLLAETLKEVAGDGAVVGRVGGDEFVAFIGKAGTKADAEQMLQRMIDRIATNEIGEGSSKHRVTASIGAANALRGGHHSFEELYRNADKALYHAKRNGKNQYALYSQVSE